MSEERQQKIKLHFENNDIYFEFSDNPKNDRDLVFMLNKNGNFYERILNKENSGYTYEYYYNKWIDVRFSNIILKF